METLSTHDWSTPGAEGEPILISTEASVEPEQARAAVLLAHGFKGYKDYGFIPVVARRLVEALPVVVHRFNFSHSGMTSDIASFARPGLFERDTWNKQVFDLDALMKASSEGDAPLTPAGLPIALLGHSRGGVSCLLCAGRRFRDDRPPEPAAVVTMSSPDKALNLSPDAMALLQKQGYLVSPSSRTGQDLRIARAWLEEQEASPMDHDVLGLAGAIGCPVLAIHGSDDPTVDPQCARRIASACPHGQFALIERGDHVYKTPNPAPLDTAMSAPLRALCASLIGFIGSAILKSD